MATRTLAHLATALFLVGCACTQVGCDNRITFALPFEVRPDVAYTTTACIGDRCSDGVLTIDGRDVRSAAMAGSLSLWADADQLALHLGDGDFAGSHRVTLTVRSEDGAQTVAFEADVEMARSQPNGPFCDPTCWSTEIDL